MEEQLRCGVCDNCKIVEVTKRSVLSESAPAGPGINDQTRVMWNTVLQNSPCDAVAAAEARLKELRKQFAALDDAEQDEIKRIWTEIHCCEVWLRSLKHREPWHAQS